MVDDQECVGRRRLQNTFGNHLCLCALSFVEASIIVSPLTGLAPFSALSSRRSAFAELPRRRLTLWIGRCPSLPSAAARRRARRPPPCPIARPRSQPRVRALTPTCRLILTVGGLPPAQRLSAAAILSDCPRLSRSVSLSLGPQLGGHLCSKGLPSYIHIWYLFCY